MKKLYAALFLISLGICMQLPAQTLKIIHRHNQPLLRIPTRLIDKVETAEVNGALQLRVIQSNGFVSEIPITQIDSITHSTGEAIDPAQLGNLRTASVMGIVRGPTGDPEMNVVVRSPYGGEEARTDPNGVFFLNNILVYDNLGYITVTKAGFHQASRSFLPLENGANRVNVQLLPMTLSGSFNAASGGTVTSGLLQLSFPANALALNGQPYTGIVRVYATALDPTSADLFDQMPGELLGGLNDSLSMLRSFGMAAVELRDANMNELQLAAGRTATLTFSIPAALQSDAPPSIDWWSFDEEQGVWMHEGVAQRQGNEYIGQATHFSWWNVDVPENFNNLNGKVNSEGGTPVSDARVHVFSPTMGTGGTYTNGEGMFASRVPKNQQLSVNVFLTCSTTNDWALAHTESIASAVQAISSSITAGLEGRYPINGTVVNCEGQPVNSGYAKMGSQVYFADKVGQFSIQTCALGEYVIRAFDTSNPDSIKASALDTVLVAEQGTSIGEIQACITIYGNVSDIDGNVYTTVLIGNQNWMAENLRTANYANGEPILNVIISGVWTQLSLGAWCNLDNRLSNDGVYGKLYNWYAVADPRKLCPTGWHVPTDAEWTILTNYLGGAAVAGGKMKNTGTQYWISPNTAATNESGFTALSGGFRDNSTGVFLGVGNRGLWWSSSEFSTGSALSRELTYNFSNSFRSSNPKGDGLSVRCLRD
jgi:uncharacterized protein (TIGR02145 family)